MREKSSRNDTQTENVRLLEVSPFCAYVLHSVCCPYPLLTIPGLLSFIALVFVWVAAINCNFFEITYWIVTEQGDAGRLGVLSVGLWTVQSYFIAASGDYSWGSFCVGWNSRNLISDLELDAPLRAARAFSMISATLGTVAFCLLLVPICVSFGEQSQYLLVLCTISVFVGFATLLDLVRVIVVFCFASWLYRQYKRLTSPYLSLSLSLYK